MYTHTPSFSDKQDVIHIYNGMLLSHKKECNECESVLMRQMNLELIIQSEVSQREKNKDHILTRIYGIYKNDTFLSFGHAAQPAGS